MIDREGMEQKVVVVVAAAVVVVVVIVMAAVVEVGALVSLFVQVYFDTRQKIQSVAAAKEVAYFDHKRIDIDFLLCSVAVAAAVTVEMVAQ